MQFQESVVVDQPGTQIVENVLITEPKTYYGQENNLINTCVEEIQSRTIFNIIPEELQNVIQNLSLPNYDLYLNNIKYTVVPLQGFKESNYLNQVKNETQIDRQNGIIPLHLQLSCKNGEIEFNEIFTDAFFLLLAYSLTKFDKLSIPQILCGLDLASDFNLPLSYKTVFLTAVNKITNVEELFLLANAVIIYKSYLQQEGYSNKKLASLLAKAGINIVKQNEMDYSLFGKVAEALLFSWLISTEDLETNIKWKELLLNQLGRKLAKLKELSPSLMGSYVQNLSDEMISFMEVLYSQENQLVTLSDIISLLILQENFEAIRNTFFERIKTMYQDIIESVEMKIREKLSQCFLSWLASFGIPINLDIHLNTNYIETYPYLMYEEQISGFTYHAPTPHMDLETNQRISQLHSPLKLNKKLQKARKISFVIPQVVFIQYDLDPSECNSSMLQKIRYPFVLLSTNFSGSQYTQTGNCIVNTNLEQLVNDAKYNPCLSKTILNIIC